MPWIVIEEEADRQMGMIDDHDECECVNVSSGTGSPVFYDSLDFSKES